MADPASHATVMSWIMEELAKSKSLEEARKDKQTRGRFSQSPLTTSESEGAHLINGDRNVRFPWIHRRQPLYFHSMKILPLKNHTVVPLL